MKYARNALKETDNEHFVPKAFGCSPLRRTASKSFQLQESLKQMNNLKKETIISRFYGTLSDSQRKEIALSFRVTNFLGPRFVPREEMHFLVLQNYCTGLCYCLDFPVARLPFHEIIRRISCWPRKEHVQFITISDVQGGKWYRPEETTQSFINVLAYSSSIPEHELRCSLFKVGNWIGARCCVILRDELSSR